MAETESFQIFTYVERPAGLEYINSRVTGLTILNSQRGDIEITTITQIGDSQLGEPTAIEI
jgi:hypothetical protein